MHLYIYLTEIDIIYHIIYDLFLQIFICTLLNYSNNLDQIANDRTLEYSRMENLKTIRKRKK